MPALAKQVSLYMSWQFNLQRSATTAAGPPFARSDHRQSRRSLWRRKPRVCPTLPARYTYTVSSECMCISPHVHLRASNSRGTRTDPPPRARQVRTHAQKHFQKMARLQTQTDVDSSDSSSGETGLAKKAELTTKCCSIASTSLQASIDSRGGSALCRQAYALCSHC